MKVSFVCLSCVGVNLCRRDDVHPSGLSESKAKTSSAGKEIDNVICLDKRHLISDCCYGNIRRFMIDMQEKTTLIIEADGSHMKPETVWWENNFPYIKAGKLFL